MVSGGLENAEETLLGLDVISKETDRLIGLVEDLLDFSKFQSGKMKLAQQILDLRSLLEELRLQYDVDQNDKKITLLIQIPDQPLPLSGDPNRLKQVFINLLDNAFKFTPPHGVIKVIVSSLESTLIIKVKDSGEGIAPEDLPKVTERFYKGSSKKSGSGLGLAICKEIIQLHRGGFHVESELGSGTTVTIELPIYAGM